MTEITGIAVAHGYAKVVTDIKSSGDGKGVTAICGKIPLISLIHIYYNTTTAYILGKGESEKHDSVSGDLETTLGSAPSQTVSISGFASSSHTHSFSGSGSVTVDPITGSGTVSVHGTTGSPS